MTNDELVMFCGVSVGAATMCKSPVLFLRAGDTVVVIRDGMMANGAVLAEVVVVGATVLVVVNLDGNMYSRPKH